MRYTVGVVVALILGLALPAYAGGHKLADRELDAITAAGYSIQYLSGPVDDALFEFQFDHTGTRTHANGEGTLNVSARDLGTLSINSLNIDRGAQQDLKALVNINAVNAIVNVLMNLVINVDSTVLGDITQVNRIRR